MDTITRQDRITLKNLKVADFASEETLCFTATVMFDGRPIAEARNDGHGGSTFVRALQGQAALLASLACERQSTVFFKQLIDSNHQMKIACRFIERVF